MKCENSLCVYQSKGKCLLTNVNIDSLGMCAECIHTEIDEKVLNESKFKLLKSLENTITR